MIDSGDTAFVLISAGLVLLMTPGLAFFYGGMVRRKNILSTLMKCIVAMCAVGLQWVLFGYSLAFGPDTGAGIIGDFSLAGLRGVGAVPDPGYAATIPHLAFMIFQAMFAIITPALIVGSIAERIRFSAFVAFVLLWTTLVYDPIAHWVWGQGGWMRHLGALDFAGGLVVHISAGVSSLVLALLIGHRIGFARTAFPPHNLPFTVLGGSLLWFGWFGFNAGSALAADGLAAVAFVNTNIAAAAAGLAWAVIDRIQNGVPTMLGMVTGTVAGLVAITPACGYVDPLSSIAIGAAAALCCYTAVGVIKRRCAFDDSLDAFGVHAVGGISGALATGLFARKAVNPAGVDGLFSGGVHLFGVQLFTVVVCIAWSALASYVLFRVVDFAIGMRVDHEEEIIGLDLTQHKEMAYTLVD